MTIGNKLHDSTCKESAVYVALCISTKRSPVLTMAIKLNKTDRKVGSNLGHFSSCKYRIPVITLANENLEKYKTSRNTSK